MSTKTANVETAEQETTDAVATAAGKKQVKPNPNPKPCKYGTTCRCKHPQHLADFVH